MLLLATARDTPQLQAWIEAELHYLDGIGRAERSETRVFQETDADAGQENALISSSPELRSRAQESFRVAWFWSRLLGRRKSFWDRLLFQKLGNALERAAAFKELLVHPAGLVAAYRVPTRSFQDRVNFFVEVVGDFMAFHAASRRECAERLGSTRALKAKLKALINEADIQTCRDDASKFAAEHMSRGTAPALEALLPALTADFTASQDPECLASVVRVVEETSACLQQTGSGMLEAVASRVLGDASRMSDATPLLTRMHLNLSYLSVALPRDKSGPLHSLKSDIQVLLKRQPGQTLLHLLEHADEFQASTE